MKRPSKHSSWWSRPEDVFRLRLQDVLIKMNMFGLDLRLQKTSSRRLDQDQYIRLGHTSSRNLQDVLQRYFQDVFKTYHQAKLFSTRLWKAFNTFLRRSFPKTFIYRGIYLGNTTSDNFMVSVQNLQEIKISQVLVFHFTRPFSGCLERRI